jgi:hypothetical protein
MFVRKMLLALMVVVIASPSRAAEVPGTQTGTQTGNLAAFRKRAPSEPRYKTDSQEYCVLMRLMIMVTNMTTTLDICMLLPGYPIW